MPFIYHIDSTDKQILTLLVSDAKMPYTEIAKRLKVSHGTIHQRIKKLEKRGIISKSTIVIDYNKLGYNFICFLGIMVGNMENINKLCLKLKKIPQITVAHITSGRFNITCKIRAYDTKHATEIINQIHKIPGVVRTESTVSFEEFVNSKEMLIKEALTGSA